MNPSGSYPQMIPGQAPVRMDGECLLPPGCELLHVPLEPDTCDAMRLIASRIEPIEDET